MRFGQRQVVSEECEESRGLNRVRPSGTYRCDVQDSSFRRVKRMYWGVRVLPAGVLNLDYDSSLARWDFAEKYQGRAAPDEEVGRMPLMYAVSLAVGRRGSCL